MSELKKVQTAIVNNCRGVRNRWDAATGQIFFFLIPAQIDLFSTVFILTTSDNAVFDEAENLNVELLRWNC